ncbi:N-6 DNA methylase [Rhodococcus sp. NPDC058532]|uniref:N-6 DNA methylase n=1 Tax=Rhodococcus sp. NPDC058532 TaxID=3346540 RepID=UPI00365EC2FB
MNAPLVRSSDIAAMADVSRAAVTQWRKRHKDFPSPVEESESDSPLFDRNEVEQWLIGRGRLPARTPAAGDVTAEAAAKTILGHLRGAAVPNETAFAGAVLVAEYLFRGIAERRVFVGAAQELALAMEQVLMPPPGTLRGIARDRAEGWVRNFVEVAPEIAPALAPLDPPTADTAGLLEALAGSVAPLAIDQFLDVFDILVRNERYDGLIDPKPLSTFVADLIDVCGLGETGMVLDPVVGLGGTLLEIGRRHASVNLIGVDFDASASLIALQRAILVNRAVDLRVGNSLGDDPAVEVMADVVVANPPWGLRDFGPEVNVLDPRWAFGRPSPRSDGIWLQQAISHLSDGGRAFVVTPVGELHRSGPPEALRQELLRQGTIEAVIALPARLFSPYTMIETALWILARPGQTVDPDRVLLVDVPPLDGPRATATPDTFRSALTEYQQWRTAGREHDTEHSIVVPVRDLLEPRSGLVPKAWIQRRDAPSPQEMIEQMIAAHAAQAEAAAVSVDVSISGLAPAGMVRREPLTALPGVRVVRSRPTHEYVDANEKSGAPVLTERILHEYLATGGAEPDRYVATDDLRSEVITQPGDIVILGVTRVGSQAAARFEFPGWVVPAQSYLVRVDPNNADAPDPDYLVACINASTHQHSRIKDSVRIMPSHVEIPVIPVADQRRIAALIRSIADATTATAQHLERLQKLAALVEIAVGTGAVTIKP